MDLDIRFATDKAGHTKTDGSVGLAGISFLGGTRHLAFDGWHGNLALEGEVLTAQALSGHIGHTDLALEGRLEHLLGYLAGTRPALALEVSVKSELMDLDELLAARTGATSGPISAATKPTADPDYRFAIAPGLHMAASCQVGRLRFRRFSPRAIRGQVDIDNQRMRLEGVRFYEVGGLFQLSGTMNTSGPIIGVDSRYSVDGARMDSLFYVMEDFGQTTLKSTQIQGRLTAEGTLALGLDHALNVKTPLVEAAADIKLTDGALLYFEPAQALGRFIDKEELKYLRFSELSNKLTIQNQVVTIPEMDIRSNLFRCYVQGTHTFGQDMEYHLRVPMAYIRRSSLEAGAGRAETGGNLLLVMRGKPGHIKIGYDMAALRDKVSQDFQEEKKNFLNIFKRKPKADKSETPPTQPPPEEPKTEDEFMNLD